MGKGSEQVAPRAFSTDTSLGETPRLMSSEDSRAHEPSRISMDRTPCVVATDALRGSQAIRGKDARYIDHAFAVRYPVGATYAVPARRPSRSSDPAETSEGGADALRDACSRVSGSFELVAPKITGDERRSARTKSAARRIRCPAVGA